MTHAQQQWRDSGDEGDDDSRGRGGGGDLDDAACFLPTPLFNRVMAACGAGAESESMGGRGASGGVLPEGMVVTGTEPTLMGGVPLWQRGWGGQVGAVDPQGWRTCGQHQFTPTHITPLEGFPEERRPAPSGMLERHNNSNSGGGASNNGEDRSGGPTINGIEAGVERGGGGSGTGGGGLKGCALTLTWPTLTTQLAVVQPSEPALPRNSSGSNSRVNGISFLNLASRGGEQGHGGNGGGGAGGFQFNQHMNYPMGASRAEDEVAATPGQVIPSEAFKLGCNPFQVIPETHIPPTMVGRVDAAAPHIISKVEGSKDKHAEGEKSFSSGSFGPSPRPQICVTLGSLPDAHQMGETRWERPRL